MIGRFLKGIGMMLLLSVVGNSEEPRCGDPVQFVQYCNLVQNPAKFDGQYVQTEAIWQKMIHAGGLADRACAMSDSGPLITLPSFARRSNFNSSLRKRLWQTLDSSGTARVRVMGKFHGRKDRPYAPDGQLFQIEIACLAGVTPLKPTDK